METVYVKESEKEYRRPYFFIKKNRFLQKEDVCICEIPRMKRKRGYLKICRYIKKKGVENICFSKLKDPVLAYDLKSQFRYINGEQAFFYFFSSIIEFMARKKGILLKDSTVVFISDDVKRAEQLISELYKKVKKIAVYTNYADAFEMLSEKYRVECGIDIEVKQKDSKPKKYRHIYVNIENKRITEEDFFKNCYCIDIYRNYKGTYNEVVFYYKTPYDTFLKENGIEKKLSFTEFYMQKKGLKSRKDYKIINIIKL